MIWSTFVIVAGIIGNIGAEASLDLLKKEGNGNDGGGGKAVAVALWTVIRTIHTSLGGGNEIVGGIRVILATWCYHRCLIFENQCRTSIVDRITFGIGKVAGIAGILTTVPALAENKSVISGVGMIVWYLTIGISVIIRSFSVPSPST